jgi:predicted kinase
VLVGVPGAGKTTYARRELGHALRICLDDLRVMLTGKSFDLATEPAVAVAADALRDSLAAYAASKTRSVPFDATHVTHAPRRPLIATARQFGFTPIAVYCHCPLAVALTRNASRPYPVPDNIVRDFSRRLVPPSCEEGFAEVIDVATDG